MGSPMPTRLPLLRLPLLVVLLALSGLLLAGAAHAAQLAPDTTPLAFEEELSAEEDEGESEDESEEGACEEAEEEFDEGERSAAEVKEVCDEEAAERRKKAAARASEECVLRSAHGAATTSGQGDKLKLTIGYTTYEPAAASLKIGRLGTVHRHLGRSGVLRLVEDLHGHNDPKQLAVQIDIPSAKSAGCPFRRLVLSPR
jgi:hypothetical protein